MSRMDIETRRKISQSRIGTKNPMYGVAPWNKGKKGLQVPWNKGLRGRPHTEEWKNRLRKKNSGENNPNWKGGINKTSNKRWRERNMDKVYLFRQRRRGRELNAEGSHTLGEWETLKAQYNLTCPCCGKKEPEIRLTEDHIIPLIKGGSNNIENIQPLCLRCNSRKHTKVIRYENEGNIETI